MLNSSEVVILAWEQMDSCQSSPEWKQEDITPCTSPNSFHSVPCQSPALQQVYDSPSECSPNESPSYYSLFDECSFNNFNTNIYLDNINSINNINNNNGGEAIGHGVGVEGYLKQDPLKFEDLLDNNTNTNQITFTETKAQVASKLLDDLDHLEHLDQWIKEEPLPFSEWLEEKIDLPIFNGGDATPQLIQQQPQNQYQFENVTKSNNYYPTKITTNDCINITPAVGNLNMSSSVDPAGDTTTQTLLQEFENVFEHHVNNTQLTPPQSPNNSSSSYITMQPVQIIQPDVAKALAVVDELVRCRVEGLVYQNDDSLQAPLSPSTSESSTTSSITGHDESSLSSSSNDPEWIPETIYQNHDETPLKHRTSKSKQHRTKPYDREVIPEDKKSRKKEQNKNAATRYRQKKKQEIAVILSEEKGLQDTNDQLHSNVNDLSREIKYLKGLMRDLFKAKGLIQ